MTDMSQTAAFYTDSSVLVTGVTGIVGKVIVERLLWSCPDIKKIYLLIRPIRGKSSEDRLEELLKSPLFDRLRKQQPAFGDKLTAVPGDLLQKQLGITKSDAAELCDEVTVVFHAASNSRQDAPFKVVMQTNLRGTQRLLDLSKQMKKLKAFVHLSTAYSNCDKHDIAEVVYKPHVEPSKMLEAISWMDEKTAGLLYPDVLGPKPNTYTLSQALTEYLLAEDDHTFTVAIIRPSIVAAAWRDPAAGWVDSVSNASGLLAAVGEGRLRVMKGKRKATADLIPVDVVANLFICAASKASQHTSRQTVVYNCTSGQLNKLTWGQIEKFAYEYFSRNPCLNLLRVPDPTLTSNGVWRQLKVLFDHLLPAHVMDLGLRIAGKKPRHVAKHTELLRHVDQLEYFTSRDWSFCNDAVLALADSLDPADKKAFSVEVRGMHWPSFMEQYCLGIKKYLLKEPLSTLIPARRRLHRLKMVNLLIKTLSVVIAFRVFTKHVGITRRVWLALLALASGLVYRLPGFAKAS